MANGMRRARTLKVSIIIACFFLLKIVLLNVAFTRGIQPTYNSTCLILDSLSLVSRLSAARIANIYSYTARNARAAH